MRSRVQSLAKELNYRPNPFARSLRKESSHIIGVVVPNLVTQYFASVMNGIDECAQENGFMVIATNSQESHEREKILIDNLLNMHVDGIIACLAQDTVEYQHYDKVYLSGTPLVFFTRTCMTDLCSSVVADSVSAAQKATQHLIDNGCRRIAFLGGPAHLDLVARRKHGYLEALKENRMPIDRSLVVYEKIDHDLICERVRELLAREDRPDAFIAFNDIATFAAYETVKAEGLRIPEDVAVIGFTNSDAAIRVTPKLSVIMDQDDIQGRTACELLMEKIQGKREIRQVKIPMKLQFRESTIRG